MFQRPEPLQEPELGFFPRSGFPPPARALATARANSLWRASTSHLATSACRTLPVLPPPPPPPPARPSQAPTMACPLWVPIGPGHPAIQSQCSVCLTIRFILWTSCPARDSAHSRGSRGLEGHAHCSSAHPPPLLPSSFYRPPLKEGIDRVTYCAPFMYPLDHLSPLG